MSLLLLFANPEFVLSKLIFLWNLMHSWAVG